MNDEARISNGKLQTKLFTLRFDSSFDIRASFVIRISAFVIANVHVGVASNQPGKLCGSRPFFSLVGRLRIIAAVSFGLVEPDWTVTHLFSRK